MTPYCYDLNVQRALYREKHEELIGQLAKSDVINGTFDLTAAKGALELLRRGCCHPQILDRTLGHLTSTHSRRHNNNNNRSTKRGTEHAQAGVFGLNGPKPLDEIMISKVDQTRTKCEELQRTLLYHLFDFASISLRQAHLFSLQYEAHPNDVFVENAVLYAIKAFCAYRYALETVRRNGQISSLLAMVHLYGDPRLIHTDVSRGIHHIGTDATMTIPHTAQGIQIGWRWWWTRLPLQSSLGPLEQQTSENIQWSWVTRHVDDIFQRDRSYCDTPRVAHTTSKSAGKYEWFQAPLVAKMQLSKSRRVVRFTYSVHSFVRDLISSMMMSPSSISSDNDNTPSSTCVVCLFPRTVELIGCVGHSKKRVVTLNYLDMSSAESSYSVETHCSVRCSQWKLQVTEIHDHCLILRRTDHPCESDGKSRSPHIQYIWSECANIERTLSVSDDMAEEGIGGHMEFVLAGNICLYETAMDADLMQVECVDHHQYPHAKEMSLFF